MECPDYTPGPVPGKVMAICRHYIAGPKEAAGSCRHPGHFMCELWLEKNRPAMAAMTRKVLEIFPGAEVREIGAKREVFNG